MTPKKTQQVNEVFKVSSGRFIGWRVGDDFYARSGKRAGRFQGDRLYHDDGSQMTWVYPSDPRRVGVRNGCAFSNTGDRGTSSATFRRPIPSDLPPDHNSAWTDP
jgi:hypothetical protein